VIPINFGNSLRIHGWMEPYELMWLASQATMCKQICEIGSWRGRSTRALLDNTSGTVLAVDTWAGSNDEGFPGVKDPEILFQEFLDNMKDVPKGKLSIFHGLSLDGAAHCKAKNQTFDMLFIDADHSYEAVKADILAWSPLVIPSGVLCGHDYSWKFPGVVQAVNELLPKHSMACETIWAVQRGNNGEI